VLVAALAVCDAAVAAVLVAALTVCAAVEDAALAAVLAALAVVVAVREAVEDAFATVDDAAVAAPEATPAAPDRAPGESATALDVNALHAASTAMLTTMAETLEHVPDIVTFVPGHLGRKSSSKLEKAALP
jgi:hypothetical protein